MIVPVLLALLPVTAAQSFSFCFSFGSKQRSHYYDYPPPYGAYRQSAVSGMSYNPGMNYPYYGAWYPAPLQLPWTEIQVPDPASYE